MPDPSAAARDIENTGRHRFHELEAGARAFFEEVGRDLGRPEGTLHLHRVEEDGEWGWEIRDHEHVGGGSR